jgi:hypothetical protein
VALLAVALACKPADPVERDPVERSGDPREADQQERVEPAKPEPPQPEPVEPEPTQVSPPELILSIRLTHTHDAFAPIEFEAEPRPQGRPLEGLAIHDCSATVPCGWAKLCEELGFRWLEQIGLPEARAEVASRSYAEAKCGEQPPLSTSGDFVANAAVIQHELELLARDRVAGVLVRTPSGWKGLARVREEILEGMSNQAEHLPRASWQLDLDEHPGKELVILTTGYDLMSRDNDSGFAWVIVCRALPEPSCRRVDMRKASRLDIYDDATFAVDGGAAKPFAKLGRADRLLITR